MKSKIKFLCVDLFCGAGGVTSGLEDAKDGEGNKLAKVVACVNHDQVAIESHKANHPDALHLTEDIRHANLFPILARLAKERKLHPEAKILLWASAECTNFSIAKGGLPRNADSRTLPNAIIRYIKVLKPDYVSIENVKEFMSWGDLDERGRPVSRDKGRHYLRWCKRIQRLGYDFNFKLLNAADYGAYTSRIRYFGVFARPMFHIRFPVPTHAKDPKGGMFGTLEKWKPVREVLDLEDEGQSIFTRKKPLVDRTMLRILAGLKKYVANGKKEWIVKYYSSHNNRKQNAGASVNCPAPTITTWLSLHLAKVNFLQSYYTNGHAHSTENPSPTITTKDRLAKVSCQWLDRNYTGAHHHQPIEKLCGTITATPPFRLVTPKWLDKRYGSGDHNHQSVNDPSGAITTTPKFSLVSPIPFIAPTNYDAAPHSIDRPYNTPAGICRPCFTLIARMDKKPPSLVTALSGYPPIKVNPNDSDTMKEIKEFMAEYGIVDIKMRMLRIKELKSITGFPKGYVLKGTKSDQKKFIGNAVPCIIPQRMIEAL